ncbi:ArsR/SmtB family transcription factor [Acetobacter conturbans]|uniref:Metalloregulator ArsR/SmtB family transcription factor n=1 Tax=Acetobacter conturbans TaxID=1737472 RepID=A0ABX0K2P1_9PROT|nr:metalloregulator ArsR/SmtB family transcription factor [Acetobacter conturbans]NHN89091.1 metalloregulator ArsR/SmtB family transcription factor [Acetobacter conturbans]
MNRLDNEEARKLTDKLKLFAQPQRFMILTLLLDGALAVSDIETRTGIGQPTLSQQIGTLRRAGIIAARRDSRSMYYSFTNDLEKETVRILLGLLRGQIEPPSELRASSGPAKEKLSQRRETVESPGGAFFARVVRHGHDIS